MILNCRHLSSLKIILPLFLFYMSINACSAKKLVNPLKPVNHRKVIVKADIFDECTKPPKALTDIFIREFYVDKNYSIVDPEIKKQNSKILSSLRKFKREIAKMAEAYFKNPQDPKPAVCALSWLHQHSTEKALLGKSNTGGDNHITWTLSSLALSYLRIKNEHSLDPDKKSEVEEWFVKLAEKVEEGERKLKYPKMNNHAYWMGLALTSCGIATQNQKLYKEGLKKFDLFLNQIQDDGTLPLELKRGKKALVYHGFSAIPLVYIAELALANGKNLYKKNNAIEKLADRIFEGFESPAYFEKLTKAKQQKIGPGSLGFLEIYASHNPKEKYKEFLKANRPFKSDILSQNLTLFFGADL